MRLCSLWSSENTEWKNANWTFSECELVYEMRYAISSSTANLGIGVIEGQLFGNTSALTTQASARITNVNAIIGTSYHTQATTPGMDRIHFLIINPSTTTTISIAAAVTNVGDTATVFAGSYLSARKIR